MLGLSSIRGQDRAVAQLRRAIEGGRVAHAYLFTGPASSGKYTTALSLAAAINCLDAPGEGCGTCAVCERIEAGIHPDVQTLERQGATRTIPIATIRAQVIPQLGLPPHEARARFFLVDEAMALLEPSANALLKTLEEPPARTHFILCTTAPENLLPTIRSRCQRVGFAGLSAEVRAELAQNDPGAADRLTELAQTLYQAAVGHDSTSLHEAARALSGERDDLDAVLELLSERFHDQARAAAMDGHLGRAAILGHRATTVLGTRRALAQSAHAQTALEALLHQLRVAV